MNKLSARLAVRLPVAAVLLCAAPLTAAAGTQLAITAVVTRFVSVAVHAQPAALVVSAADVARGFLEVPQGARLEIRSNNKDGFLLEFRNRLADDLVRGIEVLGAGGGNLAVAGGTHRVSTQSLVIGYRILLQPSAQPGTYAWPVQVVASPL